MMLKKLLIATSVSMERFRRGAVEASDAPRLAQAYPFQGAMQAAGVDVDVVSIGRVAHDRKGQRPPGWWTAYPAIVKLSFKLKKYDAVLVWDTQGVFLALVTALLTRKNRKIAIMSFANRAETGGPIGKTLRGLLYRWGLPKSGRVIFTTHHEWSRCIKETKCEQSRVAYLRSGVDTRFFVPDPSPSSGGIRSELLALKSRSYVVVAGDQQRDENLFVKILEGLNIGLVRLTQNRYTEDFWRRWSQDNPGNVPVLCVAHLDPREVRFVYQRAFCLLNVVDSSWMAAGWTVMTEAMACGLPVIVNKGIPTTEMSRYLQPGEALPFVEIDHLDPQEARDALVRLLHSDEIANQIGERARLFVERHFSIDETAKLAQDVLGSMAGQNGIG